MLLNQYVDFNKIHAVWIGSTANEEVMHQTGNFKFIINQIEAKNPIISQGPWMSAYKLYADAVKFTYLHQVEELECIEDTCFNSLKPLGSGNKGLPYDLINPSEPCLLTMSNLPLMI